MPPRQPAWPGWRAGTCACCAWPAAQQQRRQQPSNDSYWRPHWTLERAPPHSSGGWRRRRALWSGCRARPHSRWRPGARSARSVGTPKPATCFLGWLLLPATSAMMQCWRGWRACARTPSTPRARRAPPRTGAWRPGASSRRARVPSLAVPALQRRLTCCRLGMRWLRPLLLPGGSLNTRPSQPCPQVLELEGPVDWHGDHCALDTAALAGLPLLRDLRLRCFYSYDLRCGEAQVR